MAQPLVVKESSSPPKQDYSLLLDRIGKAAFDEAGRSFVEKTLSIEIFWQSCTEDEILGLAVIAQQHGLFDRSAAILSWLHREHPQCVEGWRAHLELLETLGKKPEAVQILAQARRYIPAGEIEQWGGISPLQPAIPPDGENNDRILEPFVKLRQQEDELRVFMQLFRGREEAFARQWADQEEGKQGYVPVQRPLLAEDVREHIQGKRTYGIYLLTRESKVWTGVIDVDLVSALRDRSAAEKEKATIRRESVYLYNRIMELATKAGLTCIGEVSGGKGFHFWFPVAQPVDAMDMRNGLKGLIGKLGDDIRCFSLEIFPKQDRLTGKGFGNLVKLPMGIHRGTGKKSYLVCAKGRAEADQFALLRSLQPAPAEKITALAELLQRANVVVHPRMAAWASEYPELAELESKCAMLGQIIAMVRAARALSVREEKILLGTIGHLPRGGLLLHHLYSRLPEYNRPLLDFRISKLRGTVLGCKRIHTLLDREGSAQLPCTFNTTGYPHPLLHLTGYEEQPAVQEKVVNLQDALLSLKTAIVQVERFL